MTSLGTLSRFTALAFVVSTLACGESITSGNGQPGATAARGPAPSQPAAPAPILEIKVSDGAASVFSHGETPSLSGTAYSIQVTGSRFPAGADLVSRTYVVGSDGLRRAIVNSIGVVPADGSYLSIHSGSCPSGFAEIYEVVTAAGVTTESKHAAPTC
jgi:hypothetical protein